MKNLRYFLLPGLIGLIMVVVAVGYVEMRIRPVQAKVDSLYLVPSYQPPVEVPSLPVKIISLTKPVPFFGETTADFDHLPTGSVLTDTLGTKWQFLGKVKQEDYYLGTHQVLIYVRLRNLTLGGQELWADYSPDFLLGVWKSVQRPLSRVK